MTRINVGCPPRFLVDEHLRGEYREISRPESQLHRHVLKGTVEQLLEKIPSKFCLNTGHQTFFTARGKYIERRFRAIKAELLERGVQAKLDFRKRAWIHCPDLFQDYCPTREDVALLVERIRRMMPQMPHYYGRRISREEGIAMLDLIPMERIQY